MEITDVRIKLVRQSKERLKAFCTITLDEEFVVRDIKVVEGANGLFVAMPSRKLAVPCPACRHKNHLRARFCEECGRELSFKEMPTDEDGRTKLYTDVAHPITQAFRDKLQKRVIEGYDEECESSPETAEDSAEYDTGEETDAADDYASMIAGLRRDNGSETAGAASDRQGRPSSAGRSGEGSDRGGRRRRGRRRSRPGGESPPRDGQPAAPPEEASEPGPELDTSADEVIFAEPEGPNPETVDTGRTEGARDDRMAAPPAVEESKPAVAEPVSPEEAPAPPKQRDEREDATPFGVGVI